MNAFFSAGAAPFLAGGAGLAALLVALLMSRLAIAQGWLPDHPNGRSSHQRVTPRSGGVAVFAGWLAGLGVLAFAGDPDFIPGALRLVLLAGAVFALGLIDDILELRALWKFVGQVAAAIAYVAIFGPLSFAPAPFVGDVPLGLLAAPITVFWIVGFMNAFNFMDGVNGIAAACAGFVLFAVAVAGANLDIGVWAMSAGVAAASLVGFLPQNFPGGRLFMGDNGSQTVGFLLAAMAVGAANASDGAVSALFIPTAMAPFIFDVGFTLLHRAARRQSIPTAHREHLYQLLLRLGLSHAAVTSIYLSLTALSTAAAIAMLRLEPQNQWLAPLAILIVLSAPAILVFRRAQRAGLLAGDAANAETAADEASLGAGVSHAAE